MNKIQVRREYDDRRSDPQLRYFVNCLRACLDKEPLYDKGYETDMERFYIYPAQLPAAPKRAPV